MSLDRLWADWRSAYVSGVSSRPSDAPARPCVFCELARLEPEASSGVVFADELSFCTLNAYPYGSGHLLVLPRRHEPSLSALSPGEAASVWQTACDAVRALEVAYAPDGMNLGANLGEAAGAGIPAHLHLHVLPRWSGDTNFMTSIGETRVLPESLATTYAKVKEAWPSRQ